MDRVEHVLNAPATTLTRMSGGVRGAGYRPEIAGLRAIAVLAVVIYHAGVERLSGGFVGVDVFFVISGFLITSIIVRDLEAGRFSFAEFYSRRAKRLFPAAIATVFATLAFGWVMLGPGQYMKLAESSVAALFFSSNFYFMLNTGYFDQSADVLPLLHMWSLGVEEQFYIVMPLLVFLAFRWFGMKGIVRAVAAVSVLTLLLSLAASGTYPKFSFFMLATRAWELGLGAIVALAPRLAAQRMVTGNVLSIAGLALIVTAIFLTTPDVPYPGVWALLPTMGTALVVYGATARRNLVGVLLSAGPLEWVGKISYSCYLWHWPLVVYYRIYISERAFALPEVAALVAGSLFLGWLSWRYVEERFRYSRSTPIGAIGRSFGAITLVSVFALAIIIQSGIPSRENPEAAALTDLDKMWEFKCVDTIRFPSAPPACVVGVPWKKAATKGILWGDSHSEHFAPVFHSIARRLNMALVVGPRSCPPFLDGDGNYMHASNRPNFIASCETKQASTKRWLQENKDVTVIVMASAWSGYLGQLSRGSDEAPYDAAESALVIKDGLVDLIKELDLDGRSLLLLGDMPRPRGNLNPCVALSLTWLWRSKCQAEIGFLDAKAVRDYQRPSNQALLEVARLNEHVSAIIPTDKMCSQERCRTFVNGEFIYRDGNHIRRNLKQKTLRTLSRALGLNEYLQARAR